ncbi:cytochrome P450 [Streptacidiphilus sp. P02-A3a]|uniref:cytochrome P450 n=1 Tax=Streptacidiphilus sp. P02-A3a TaxID=2704468 RepID=UPI0015FAE3E0|nr:cytochrome P450 [Streptacidiphilus sp. P02-A3a]QMU73239.1 cytochrome P450 [Streptacidiphilus sp. P02-A3a]
MTISDLVPALETPSAVLARLMSPEGLTNPYPHYHALRALAPVHKAGNIHFLTGYAECQQVLNDPSFRVQDPQWYDANLPGWRDSTATRLMYQSMQSRNNPDHNRLRRMVGGAFSPRRMAEYRLLVERVVGGMLDRMADAGSDGSPVDLMSYLAYPLPTAVIGEMLGVPEEDREHFRGLGIDFFTVMDLYVGDDAQARSDAAAKAMLDYWSGMVRDRRRSPREDLTTELTRARDAGALSEDELLGLLMFLFTAGYGTTAALLGNAAEQLLLNPAEADRLRLDDSVTEAVVEESLRHEPPSQIAPRMTSEDRTVGGVDIPAGQLLVALLGAANRDPAQYAEPDRFLPSRPPGRVLSFGGGLHFCIGAALSRMEGAVVLPRLVRRFPRLAMGGTPVRRQVLRMRLHSSFPVDTRG